MDPTLTEPRQSTGDAVRSVNCHLMPGIVIKTKKVERLYLNFILFTSDILRETHCNRMCRINKNQKSKSKSNGLQTT
jgi:hypothetical protein